MLEQVIQMLNLPDDKTVYAQFALDTAADLIMNYCNVKEVPDGLRRVCISMAMDIYRAENYGNEDTGLVVKSITEGSVSTSFETKGRKAGSNDDSTYLTPYLSQLRRYRRL